MRKCQTRRAGVTYLEVQVAMVVLSIALAGLCPLMLMQLKLLRKLETPGVTSTNPQIIKGVRMVDGVVYATQGPINASVVSFFQPQPDAWVRRMGLQASIRPGVTSQTYPIEPTQQTVAVGDPGFAATGWTTSQDPAQTGTAIKSRLPGDILILTPATWDFSGIAPGYYRVLAIWPAAPQNAPDASYVIKDGGATIRLPPPMDQRVAPDSSGLGVFFLNGSLQVKLAASGAGRVVADAVRIVPLNKVTIQSPFAATSAGYQVTVGAVPQ